MSRYPICEVCGEQLKEKEFVNGKWHKVKYKVASIFCHIHCEEELKRRGLI